MHLKPQGQGSEVTFQLHPAATGKNSPDRSRVTLQRADHRKLLQIPQLDGPASTCRVHTAAAH